MKMTKRILAFALILMLTLSLSAPAFAEEAQYKATKDFMAAADEVEGLTCSYEGMVTYGEDKLEQLALTYAGEISNYRTNFFGYFDKAGDVIILYLPNIISFAEDDLLEILCVVNELNAASTGVKLYVDTDANTVDGELYLLATEDAAATIALTGCGLLIAYTDSIYEGLLEYDLSKAA